MLTGLAKRLSMIILFVAVLMTVNACQTPNQPSGLEVSTTQPTSTGLPDDSGDDQPSTITPAVSDSANTLVSLADEGRYLIILRIAGDVTVQLAPGTDERNALTGMRLNPPARLSTGTDGEAILELDDGTLILVTSETTLDLEELSGETAAPLTRFFMNLGEVFVFREGLPPLPENALFEIETPRGIAAIRGSSMNIRLRPVVPDQPETTEMITVCLSGSCVTQGSATTEETPLTDGQLAIINPQNVTGGVESAAPEDIERGQEARQRVIDAAEQPEQIALCHATGDLTKPYIELHIRFSAADGHGHEGHEDDIIPLPEDGCPAGDDLFVGTWVSVDPVDQSSQILTITRDEEVYNLTLFDEGASVCGVDESGNPVQGAEIRSTGTAQENALTSTITSAVCLTDASDSIEYIIGQTYTVTYQPATGELVDSLAEDLGAGEGAIWRRQ